jgi:hypothetical protein
MDFFLNIRENILKDELWKNGTCDVPCDVFRVGSEGTKSATRELVPTSGVRSLIRSVKPVARRVLTEFPFALLVVECGIIPPFCPL